MIGESREEKEKKLISEL